MSAETRADAPPAPGARAWLRLAPAVLPFLLYAPALGFGLLGYDDVYYYRLNAPLRGGAWRGLFELWAAPLYSDYFPLTQLTLWLDLAVGGERFWFARLHAIAWLAAGALGLRASIERLTGRPGLALTVATLYAVHPAAGGSVLWLAQRKNLVALALCLWSFERYLAAGTSADRGAAWKARGASFGLAAAALLAKSHAVALPAALLAYEGLLGRGSWARRLARVGPFAAAAAGMVAANLLWIRDDLGGALLGGGRLEALAADGPIVLRYLSLFAMPTLSFFYQVAEPGAASAWGWGRGRRRRSRRRSRSRWQGRTGSRSSHGSGGSRRWRPRLIWRRSRKPWPITTCTGRCRAGSWAWPWRAKGCWSACGETRRRARRSWPPRRWGWPGRP
ncbi:MAG: hypothetical protein M5U26_16610 [Planctomycetota bacterium]|nr:hypothetical protein [Planctomycetota bacterium]